MNRQLVLRSYVKTCTVSAAGTKYTSSVASKIHL